MDGVTKQKAKNNEEKKEEVINKIDCTFVPKVNRFNSHVFDVNPLLHDEMVQKEVERFERARIEKKIAEIQKNKGIMSLKQFKNLDVLLKDEELVSMKFGLEKKTYKDSIDIHSKQEKKSPSHNVNMSRDNFNKTVKFNKTNGTNSNQEPLLSIEVNIDDSNRLEKLEIYPNDDPLLAAETFCRKYGLTEDKKIRLQKIIEEKLNENIGSSSNRS